MLDFNCYQSFICNYFCSLFCVVYHESNVRITLSFSMVEEIRYRNHLKRSNFAGCIYRSASISLVCYAGCNDSSSRK